MTDDARLLLDPVDRPMRRLFTYLASYRRRLAGACAASVTNKVLDLMPPLLTAWLVECVERKPRPFITAAAGADVGDQLVFIGVLTVVIFGLESFFQWLYAL